MVSDIPAGDGKIANLFYSLFFIFSVAEVCHEFSAKMKASKKNWNTIFVARECIPILSKILVHTEGANNYRAAKTVIFNRP